MSNFNVVICIFYLFSCILFLCTCYPLHAHENGKFSLRDLRLFAHNKGLAVKKDCKGFPCMYSQLGSKAGHHAMIGRLMTMIDECANDVMCSPGKRRRKRNAIKILRRHFGEDYLKGH